MMVNGRSTLRSKAAVTAAALLLAACGSDRTLGPDVAPQYNDVPPWKLFVCKNAPIQGTVASFTVTATSGTVTANPLLVTVAGSPSCLVAWEGAAGTPVTVTVTENETAGQEFLSVTVGPREAPGYTINGATVTITDEYFAAFGGASITYRNDNVEQPPLQATKTAAGRFEIPVRWELVKTVTPTSHTGTIGTDAGSSTWTVTATRVEGAATNHVVAGSVTVTNPASVARTFSVSDVVNGVAATVSCPTNTVAAGGSVTCTYTAPVAGATSNTATVSSPGLADITASAPVSYTSSFTGDQTVTLADPRFTYSQSISSSTTVTFPETFPCPSDPAVYVNGTHTRTETNTATLKGDNTDLTRTAQVTITCTKPEPPQGETATGQGFPWAATQGAPSNWFMYTPWATTGGHRGISAGATSTMAAGTNLIAGQHYIAGRITGSRGTTTTITITLNSDWGFLGEEGNVKINPMSCTTGQPYVQPGGFTVHRTAAVSANSITVTGLPNTACYGIHVDVVEK